MASTPDIGDSLKDRTDAEILAWIDSLGGVEPVLEGTFSGMRDAFHADRAEGQRAVIQWDIAAPSGVVRYQIDVAGGVCTVRRDGSDEPRVRLSIGLADFMRLVTGLIDGRAAATSGRLTLAGDVRFAETVSAWFEGRN
jgi:putative sterol carrier protein